MVAKTEFLASELRDDVDLCEYDIAFLMLASVVFADLMTYKICNGNVKDDFLGCKRRIHFSSSTYSLR